MKSPDLKLASIDIGSNSFLLLLCYANSHGISKIEKDVIEIVRLGQGLSSSSRFLPEALARAKETLSRFRSSIDGFQPDIILAKATAAARLSENRDELLKIGAALGLQIEIIPGEREAQVTYQGVFWGQTSEHADRNLLIDIGGGSTELIVGHGLEIEYSISIPFGAVLLTEKYIKKHPVRTEDEIQLIYHIENQMETVLKSISKFNVKNVFAVAGTPTTLAQLVLGGYDDKKINGFQLPVSVIKEWEQKLKVRTVEERVSDLQVPRGRADILYAGAVLLRVLLQKLRMETVTVSTRGVRHGIVADYFLNQKKGIS